MDVYLFIYFFFFGVSQHKMSYTKKKSPYFGLHRVDIPTKKPRFPLCWVGATIMNPTCRIQNSRASLLPWGSWWPLSFCFCGYLQNAPLTKNIVILRDGPLFMSSGPYYLRFRVLIYLSYLVQTFPFTPSDRANFNLRTELLRQTAWVHFVRVFSPRCTWLYKRSLVSSFFFFGNHSHPMKFLMSTVSVFYGQEECGS